MATYIEDFRSKLIELRERKATKEGRKITQEIAAKEMEMSRPALGSYEAGTRLPDIEYLIKICNYYDISCDYLLGLDRLSGLGGDSIDLIHDITADDQLKYLLNDFLTPLLLDLIKGLYKYSYSHYDSLKNVSEHTKGKSFPGPFGLIRPEEESENALIAHKWHCSKKAESLLDYCYHAIEQRNIEAIKNEADESEDD
ncbi:MAG: helix-turn-helix transcriptional regulator [Lachnospiraceae bacterium]|nr:helix-turn-helix transcriptional regulator [Lachnospiraceae bacterium]